jgi:hypothetical protein
MTAPAAKAKPQTIKLEPGTDLIGTVKFVSFFPEKEKDGEKYGAQWSLLGTWNGQEGRVYIDVRKLSGPALAPYVQQDGQWDDGSPKWKWTGTGAIRLHPFVKDKKHYVTVTAEKNGSTPVQQNEPEPEDPTDEARAIRRRWADMQESYECCVKIAVKAWGENIPEGPDALANDSLVAAAATLFIEANKRNLPPPPKREAE